MDCYKLATFSPRADPQLVEQHYHRRLEPGLPEVLVIAEEREHAMHREANA
jgi:hypothetical protein